MGHPCLYHMLRSQENSQITPYAAGLLGRERVVDGMDRGERKRRPRVNAKRTKSGRKEQGSGLGDGGGLGKDLRRGVGRGIYRMERNLEEDDWEMIGSKSTEQQREGQVVVNSKRGIWAEG